jgi:hypothetical protein
MLLRVSTVVIGAAVLHAAAAEGRCLLHWGGRMVLVTLQLASKRLLRE